MPLKKKHIRKPKAIPLNLAKYQVGKTNSCLNLIFKGATRRYDWMIDPPVVHPSFAPFNGATGGGDAADAERDGNQNDSTGGALADVSRNGYGMGKTNIEPGSVVVNHNIESAPTTDTYATDAGDSQVITATVSRKTQANEKHVETISSDDDEVQILSPIITRAEAMASRMHSLHSDESAINTTVTTSHKRKATDEIINCVYDGDATSWKMARKRQQQSKHRAVHEAAAALTLTLVDTQTGAKKYNPIPGAEDNRWNIWSVGNLSGKFGKIGFKLDVLREVLKKCDRAGGFKVLTRVNFTSEKLIKEVLEWRNSIASVGYAPPMWDEEKPWWVWMPEDGSTVDMGSAAEPGTLGPGLGLLNGNKTHGYSSRKRAGGDRKARPKKAKAAIEGPEDLESWLDHELATEDVREEKWTLESKEMGEEDELDLELLLDLELALQAELEPTPVLESKTEGETINEREEEKAIRSNGGRGGAKEHEESVSEEGSGVDESEVSEEE